MRSSVRHSARVVASAALLLCLLAVTGCGLFDDSQNSGTTDANLIVDLITVTSTPPFILGQDIFVTIRVRNVGTEEIGGTLAGVYLSTNINKDAGDIHLGNASIGALNAGGNQETTYRVPIPTGIASGLYKIVVRADDEDSFTETDESDNDFASSAYFAFNNSGPLSNDPNLRFTSALTTSTLSAFVGDTFNVTAYTIRNDGGTQAGAYRVAFYLSTDQAITREDIQILPARDHNPLNPGTSEALPVPHQLRIPTLMPPGTYFLGAIIDIENQVAENDEANNVTTTGQVAGPLTIDVQPAVPANRVDLSFSAMTIDTDGSDTIIDAGTGETLTIDYTVAKPDALPCGPIAVAFYLSEDNVVDPLTDNLLGIEVVAPHGLPASQISVSGQATFTPMVSIPRNAGLANSYFVLGVVDPLSEISENNETNNEATPAALEVTNADGALGMDVAVANLAVDSGSTPAPGADVLVTYDVTLTGSPTTPIAIGFYISAQIGAVEDANSGDLLIGTDSVTVDEVGRSITLQIPFHLAPSTTVTLVCMADPDDQVTEDDETTNQTTTVDTLLDVRTGIADFSTTVVTVASTGAQVGEIDVSAGDRLEVTVSVENVGTAAAGPFRIGVYLSFDRPVQTSDRLIGVIYVSGLKHNTGTATFTFSEKVSVGFLTGELLFGVVHGPHYVGGIADINNDIYNGENESDNVRQGDITIVVTP